MKISTTPFIVIPNKSFFNISLKDVFILDIGTDSIKVYSQNKDLLIQEPSVIVTELHSSKVLAYGNIGKNIFNKLPQKYVCSRPIQNGKIVDKRLTNLLLRYILNQITSNWHLSKATCYCMINNNIAKEDQETIATILKNQQIGKVIFLKNTDIYLFGLNKQYQNNLYLLLELGAGYSQIALVKNNKILNTKDLTFTGHYLDLQIVNYIANKLNMFIGEFEAKRIKEEYASATELFKNEPFELYGKDLITSYHKKFKIDSSQVYFAIKNAVEELLNEIINFLISQDENLKEELQESLSSIYITGGLSSLTNLIKFLSENLPFDIKLINEQDNAIYNIQEAKNILLDKIQMKEYYNTFRSDFLKHQTAIPENSN